MNQAGASAGFAAAAWLCLTPPAAANDSVAGLANGSGIVLRQTHDIEMRAETLTISAERITVQYRFHNRSGQPLTTMVAFPMPDIRAPVTEAMTRAMPSDDAKNAFGFTALVDGKPVPLRSEQKAVTPDGADHADLLHRLGVPLRPDTRPVYDALLALPRERRDELIKLGLARIIRSDNTPNAFEALQPEWIWQTTYYWDQTFPANADTIVEHRYSPSVGRAFSVYALAPLQRAAYRKRYCTPANLATLIKKATALLQGGNFVEQRIDYVLKSGANWAGPIGEFRLVIDQQKPENLTFACLRGLRKIAPTRYAWERRNFTPKRDLAILILDARPPE
jgi:hypothetical protein